MAMPRYFFDLIGRNVMKDRTGIELSSDAAACREAILRGTNGASVELHHDDFESIVVRGTAGSVICAAPIRRKK
jgi:hypothetical protein